MNKSLFDEIVYILVPFMATPQSRLAIVQSALIDSPIRNNIDWDGPAEFFTRNLVTQLIDHDRKKLTLIALLNEIKKYIDQEQHTDIENLIARLESRPLPQETNPSIHITHKSPRLTNLLRALIGFTLFVIVALSLYVILPGLLVVQPTPVIPDTPTKIVNRVTPSESPSQTPLTPTKIPVPSDQLLLPSTKTPIPPPATLIVTMTPDLTAISRLITEEPLAFIPITNNTLWKPIERTFDGVEMVLVPVGCFHMGSTTFSDTQPVEEHCFDTPFWIDKHEVTNIQFSIFRGLASNPGRSAGPNRPRETVTWFEAYDFCKLRDQRARLPTEKEWEYAAHGPSNWAYPWGNVWSRSYAIWGDSPEVTTADIGSRPVGRSWVGALDMAGNVSEWTSSEYKPYPYLSEDGRENYLGNARRVLRGGSWFNNDVKNLLSVYRSSSGPNSAFDFVGFRCLRSI